MDSQVEKASAAEPQSTTTTTLGNLVPNPENEHEHEQELPKILNGGLEAWLGVFAGFCIFVNSW